MKFCLEINITKCYGSFGCFDLNPPWTSIHRPVSLLPEDSRKVCYCVFTLNIPIIFLYVIDRTTLYVSNKRIFRTTFSRI